MGSREREREREFGRRVGDLLVGERVIGRE